MIKIAICDANRDELAKARKKCMAYGAKLPERDVLVTTFEDAGSALTYVGLYGGFDIMTLDVYMPEITGMELARTLEIRTMGARSSF